MKIYCLADRHTVTGFALVGIEGRGVATPAEAAHALGLLARAADCALVLMTSEVATLIPIEVERVRLGPSPLVLELPSGGGPVGSERGLAALAEQAVGVRLGEEGG